MNTITDIRAIHIVIGNTLVRAGKIVFQLFLNIFIWKHTGGDLQIVALFNLIYILFHTFSFLSVAFLVKAGYGKWLNLIALLGYTLVYLVVMMLGNSSLEYIYWIASAIGVFNGMYYINYHYSYFFVTSFANRGNYEGIKKSIGIIASVCTPPLVGSIIALNYMGWGYEMAFGFGALLFFLAAYISNISLDIPRGRGFELRKVFSKVVGDKDIFRSLYTYGLTGFSFSNTVLEVILPVLLFSYIGSELDLGILVGFFSIVSFIGAYIFGKFVDYKYYSRVVLVAGILYCLCLLGFVYAGDLKYMILFTAVINFVIIFFSLPQKVISDNIMHKLENHSEYRGEYMVIREIFLSVGWLTSFSILYFVGGLGFEGVKLLFLAMVFFTFLSTLLLYTVNIHHLDKQ